MERDELIRYVEFLLARLDEEKRTRELSEKRVSELLDRIDQQGKVHSQEMQALLLKNQELQQSIADLTAAINLGKKNRFASKSQKSRPSTKKDDRPSRDEEREDHDGTPTGSSSEFL